MDSATAEYSRYIRRLRNQVPKEDRARMKSLCMTYRWRIPPECRRFARLDSVEAINVWLSMSPEERERWFEQVEGLYAKA